ncbi:MAG: acyltransferase, partial [Bacteroidetes bacterium]|nr:acyltransferase [Bacteroidota bacterium]
GVFYLQERGWPLKPVMRLKWLGDCSYTLYIVHFPVLVFCSGLILHFNHNTLPKTQLYIVAAILFTILLSHYLHRLIERPFINKRRRMEVSNA